MNVQASEAFRDIYGLDENNIYAAAGSPQGNRRGELYHFEGSQWSLIKTASLTQGEGELRGPLYSVWPYDSKTLYTSGGTVASRINNLWEEEYFGYAIYKVRGNKPNDIFISGAFGKVSHYNGLDWYHYTELDNQWAIMEGIFCCGNVVYIAGDIVGGEAIIYKGTN